MADTGPPKASQNFLIPLIARRIAILNGHSEWQPETTYDVAVLEHSLTARPSGDSGSSAEAGRHDQDAAIEMALSRSSLQRMMLYPGALVKVGPQL